MNRLPSAADLGLIGCPACSAVFRLPEGEDASMVCTRCGAPLHRRKQDSISRTWAYLIAAIILYFPANLMTMMKTSTLMEQRADTILSGIIALWQKGSPEIAVIVFVASIVVPVLKILVLGFLLVSVQKDSNRGCRQRARLYRIIEFVGYWSMLDVFVVALLVALVHFRALADVQPGPGAIAFAAVVVLTMLASRSFDPRLIWDRARPASQEH